MVSKRTIKTMDLSSIVLLIFATSMLMAFHFPNHSGKTLVFLGWGIWLLANVIRIWARKLMNPDKTLVFLVGWEIRILANVIRIWARKLEAKQKQEMKTC